MAKNNRVAQVVSGSFSAHTFHSLRAKFLFKKIVVIIPLGFYLSKSPQSFSSSVFIGFHSKFECLKSLISRKKTDPSV